MRWVVLAFLTSLAVFASLGAAVQTKPSGRAELALTTCIVWNVLVGAPIYALGLTGHLTAPALGVTSALLSSVVLALVTLVPSGRSLVPSGRSLVPSGRSLVPSGRSLVPSGRSLPGRGAALRTLGASFIDLAALPFEGIARAARARSLVVLALVLCAILIPYTAFASYFTPSWRQWDALWYHETIVGFSIQTHSFAPFPIYDDAQKANGYPRFCEMIQLWFVIFTDRRLIDLPNSLMAPGFMYATYLLARRYSRGVIACMAWAAVAMIMPNSSYLLQSTYVDPHVALFVIAGTYYATRPEYRLVDAWLAAICVTLAIGSKYLALPPAGIILLIALARLLGQLGLRLRALGTLLGGGAVIAAMSAEVFWRNWKYFKNPFWPDLQYDNAARGIHLPFVQYGAASPLDMNMKVKDLLEAMFAVPYSVTGLGPKGQLYDYGFAVIWIVFPLSAVAIVVALFLWARDLVARIVRVGSWRAPEAANPLLVALPVVAQVWLSPALWGGRYHIANVAALAAIVAFLGGRPRWHSFGAGAATAAAVASIIVFCWVKPRWIWFPDELAKLAAIPYPEREVTPASEVSKAIDFHSGSAITREVGLARERLKPGEIFAFDYTQFPALLWNNTFSNRILYVPGGAGYFERVVASGARMANCQNGSAHCAEFIAASAGPHPTWKDLGVFNVENWAHIYERLPGP